MSNQKGTAPIIPFRAAKREHARSRNSEPPSYPPEGTVLNDRYQITGYLASGGNSRICRAWDMQADALGTGLNEVALKILAPDDPMSLRVDMLGHEIGVAKRLSHPGIIRIHDGDRTGCWFYLVMEYLRGPSLAERLRQRCGLGLAYSEAATACRDALRALDYLHREGIAHGDIKPANLMLHKDRRVKLIDFATAEFWRGDVAAAKSQPEFIGYSPRYASPARMCDEPLLPGDDIYAWACTAYELFSGTHPYAGDDGLNALKRRAHPTKPKGLPGPVWRVLRKALQLDPARRYRDSSKLLRDFETALTNPPPCRAFGTAAAGTGLIAVVLLGWPLADNYVTQQRAQQEAESLAVGLREADLAELPRRLAQTGQLPPLLGQGVLRSAQQPVIEKLALHAEQTLMATAQAAELVELEELLASARRHYPDSARLAALDGDLRHEKQLRITQLGNKLQAISGSTDFSHLDAARIGQWQDQLATLGVAPPADWGTRLADRLRQTLIEADAEHDFATLARIVAFTESLGNPVALDRQLGAIPQHRLADAAVLADAEQFDYPRVQAAKRRFWSPRLQEIRTVIENNWGTPALTDAMRGLQQLQSRAGNALPEIQDAKTLLAKRFQAKANYYAARGNRARAASLQQRADELFDK